jgi:hypothetical protein
MCFEKILIKSPNEIICHVCALISSWTGLNKQDLQDLLQGAKLLVRAVSGRQILGSNVEDDDVM